MADSLQRFVDDAFRALEADADLTLPVEPMICRAEVQGDRIGHYTLVEELGCGGFGVVWRAEQSRPVRREVALKIIKAGMDTREIIMRFEAERQALAVMDHPNIAKVFDAGATPAGRPYFVMELVQGAPFTQYCNEQGLTLPQRLALFADVCRAIQHAHQKGIIHRDLKPSNLLIAVVDGKPVPKVIDFGIAKATGAARLTEQTLVTRIDRLMGTPAYMSPEQAEPGMDIDTRSDIYSLGVVLYELLTGQVPFEIGPDGKAKRQRDPQKPSTRIRSLTAEQRQKLGDTQHTEPPKLIGLVKGDLDWIAMKAIEQDRTRRYDSANSLAADVDAFLRQEPVTARPPTRLYLLGRFALRNKLAVGAAAAIMLVLIAGGATSTWMYLRERDALAKSQQVSRFLKETLEQAGISKSLGRDATMMREILDKTAERIGLELQSQPDVEAELRNIIGATYEDLDEYALAVAQQKRALELARGIYRGDHPDLAQMLWDYASALEHDSRPRDAEPIARESLAMRQRLFGDGDQRTARSHALLAWILVKSGRSAEGESSARIAVAVERQPGNDPGMFDGARALAAIFHNTNRPEESIKLEYETLAELRKLRGPEHPDIVLTLDNLGVDLCRVKRFDEAEPLLLESLRQGEIFFKGRNPHADHVYAGLSRVAASRQQWDKQLEYARAGMAAAKAVFPVGHRYYREASTVLARVLIEQAERLTKSDPPRALAILDELAASKDFASEVKAAGGWFDCLRGCALMADQAKREAAKASLVRGVGALKRKTKPTAEDTRRLKKAEAVLAGLQ